MNTHSLVSGRWCVLGLAVFLIAACGHKDLPDVPPFSELGFADALDAVREQMQIVYAQWQEQPHDAEQNGNLGMHLSVYGKNAAAWILFQRARSLAPDDFRWPYYLGFTSINLNRLEDAAAMFREALKIDPDYLQARIHLAEMLWRTAAIDESADLYQSISTEYPQRVEGWLGLGKVYRRRGDLDAAATALRRARAVGSQYGEVHYALAQVLRELGDADEAARELAAYTRTADKKIQAADELIQKVNALHIGDESFLSRGSMEFSQGRFRQAAKLFRTALKKNPAAANAWVLLFSSYVQLGELDTAENIYREALAAGISYSWLHLVYGLVALETGKLDVARDVVGTALELNPQYAEAFVAMGEIELQSGNAVAAVEQFRAALEVQPGNRNVELSLAGALNAAGQFGAAAQTLEPLTTDPALDRSAALKELAIAYYGLGRKDEAIDALERGRELARILNRKPMLETLDALLEQWQSGSAR